MSKSFETSASLSGSRATQKFTEIQMSNMHIEDELQNLSMLSTTNVLELGLWFFQVLHLLKFTISSLYIALSMLDRLHKLHFQISTNDQKLLGGALLLISTKFNEVRQLKVKEINKILTKTKSYSLNKYVTMESKILQALSFHIVQQQNTFIKFLELQEKLNNPTSRRIQRFCKICLEEPTLLRYGTETLIQSVFLICESQRPSLLCQNSRHIQEIMQELRQLQECIS